MASRRAIAAKPRDREGRRERGACEEQARLRPCRSALSIGGLIKHATYGMRGVTERLSREGQPRSAIDEAGFAAYQASFALADGETAIDALAAFDAARVEYVAALAAADPSSPTIEDPAPWFGVLDNRPARRRYLLVHQIEEMARHAGHADIIREQIDGMSVPAIVLTADGMPASDYFAPSPSPAPSAPTEPTKWQQGRAGEAPNGMDVQAFAGIMRRHAGVRAGAAGDPGDPGHAGAHAGQRDERAVRPAHLEPAV